MSTFKLALFFVGLFACDAYATRSKRSMPVRKPLPLDQQFACIAYNTRIQVLKDLKRKPSKVQKEYYALTCKFGFDEYKGKKRTYLGTAGEHAALELIKYDIQKKRIQ